MRFFSRILFLICLSAFSSSLSFAQTGQLHGSVHDEESGEALIGVNILLVGTRLGAATDLDGNFIVRDVPPARYDVRISYVGYAAKVVTGVEIKADQSFKLDVSLHSETYESEEVVVTAERVVATEAALLSERKRAATIGDGFSAESVKQSPDATSGDALKRVTGVNIVDSKFVFVRGVTDRYNSTMLNGVSVTTTDTDTDKKSFSFDMVPANLLENTIITKTATPDLPGDFTGGLVQLKTIDFPTQRVVKLTLSSAYNNITNAGEIQKSQAGGSDWLGRDDGTRAFPEKPVADGFELGRTLSNSWAQRTEKAPLSGNFNLNIGDAIALGSNTLGYIAGLSYRNSYSRAEKGFDYFRQGSRINEGQGTVDSYNVLWGGLLDLNFKLSGNHKISWKNNFNQTAQENVSLFENVDENLQYIVTYDTEWEERTLYVTKLSGEHFFASRNNLELLWQGSYTESSADEPDHKTVRYSRNVDLPEDPLATGLGQRSWSELQEYTRSFGADMILHLGDSRLKFGAFAEGKTRDYQIRFYLVEPDGFDAYPLLTQPIDSVYRPEHFAPDSLTMSRLDNPRDLYDGTSDLYATYLMADFPLHVLGQNFRVVGGARVENSDIRVNTISPTSTNEPFTAILHKVDVLPSLNFTYFVNDLTNLRLAYSQSVNRPEFREMSSFYFYDYVTGQGKYGNPYLTRAFSKNYDVRLELFPGLGELLAFGYFYKDISGAIEQQIVISSNPELTWFNSPAGKNYGWEVEVRKNLGFLGGYFRNFAIAGNYTRVFSEIKYPLFFQAQEYGVREMQGQAPWVINASFIFREPTLGTTVSVLYNEFGKRLEAVGDQRELDVFEEPLGTLDFAVTQPITGGLSMKFAIRDWGAGTRKFVTREGNPYSSVYRGTSYGLEASLSL
jgi:hypothetical protein